MSAVSLPTRRDLRRMYASGLWRDVRGAALYMKGRLCARCGTTRGPFHVDHIVPARISWAARFSIWNLQVLCRRCHLKHKKRKEVLQWR